MTSLDDLKAHLTQKLCVYCLRFEIITHERMLWTQTLLAEFAGCSVSKIKEAIQRGEIKTVSNGRIPRSEVIRYLGGDPTLDIATTIVNLQRSLDLIENSRTSLVSLPLSA